MANDPLNPRTDPSAQPNAQAGQADVHGAQRAPLPPPKAMPAPPAVSAAAPEPKGEGPQTLALPQGVACACAALDHTPDFPSARNRAARLAALASQDDDPAPHGKLTAYDYAVALGKPNQSDPNAEQQVAGALAQAWAEDGDVLRYQSEDYREAAAPPGMDSPAAAGWQPTAQVRVPVANRTYARAEPGQANQLFEAYGASYPEAYAAALSVAFSEDKPLPDDTTGDVTGLISSIMHTPSGEPILLGSVFVDKKADDAEEHADAGIADEPPLPLSRKVTRGLLLVLGAGTLAVAGLYFTGYLL